MPELGPKRTKQNKQNKTKHKQQEKKKKKAVELEQGRKEIKNKDYIISDEGQITLEQEGSNVKCTSAKFSNL